MGIRVRIEGLNLEKLLCAAAQEGIALRRVTRLNARGVRAEVSPAQMKALAALCERYGWQAQECGADVLIRAGRLLVRHAALLAGMLLCAALVYLSSMMLLRVQIENAGVHEAVLRAELSDAGVRAGRLKQSLSLDALRGRLQSALPGLSFVGVRFAGSTLVIACWPSVEGEDLEVYGEDLDIVAAEAGVVKSIWVSSGTPLVEPGQAVYKGQTLIRGEERTEKGERRAVKAQGQVIARVWASGEARVSLYQRETIPTGRTRRRVTVASPWHERVATDAQPFDKQDVRVEIQPVVGLYLPLVRRIETFEEIEIIQRRRDIADCRSMAQGAAEEIAKNNCPSDAQILDKWVEYSTSDDGHVIATVVLEYETDISGRRK